VDSFPPHPRRAGEARQRGCRSGGRNLQPALVSPFRWQDWAAPFKDEAKHPQTDDGKPNGWKRQELFSKGDGKLFDFINTELLPHLHALDFDPQTKLPNPTASRKQRVIGRIMTAVERVRVDSETNLRDILDKVDEISIDHVDDTHFFTLSQVYEDLLLKMGEKNSDGGQFFTPREVIRAMVHTLQPKLGETIYDPCCGTGGFLAVAYEHIARNMGKSPAATEIDTLKHDTFFGREKENLVFPIALANLVLHGIDQPNLWHGNTLTKRATYSALFDKAPKSFDVILTNPPFGGKEGKDAQKNYAYATGSTQVLFVQDTLVARQPQSTYSCARLVRNPPRRATLFVRYRRIIDLAPIALPREPQPFGQHRKSYLALVMLQAVRVRKVHLGVHLPQHLLPVNPQRVRDARTAHRYQREGA
jgi:type I restriction enzyme M protein